MLGRARAFLTAQGREWRVALAASLAFHLVGGVKLDPDNVLTREIRTV